MTHATSNCYVFCHWWVPWTWEKYRLVTQTSLEWSKVYEEMCQESFGCTWPKKVDSIVPSGTLITYFYFIFLQNASIDEILYKLYTPTWCNISDNATLSGNVIFTTCHVATTWQLPIREGDGCHVLPLTLRKLSTFLNCYSLYIMNQPNMIPYVNLSALVILHEPFILNQKLLEISFILFDIHVILQ